MMPQRQKSADSANPRATRLTINLGPEAIEFLDELTKRRGISYTEAVRRALAICKIIEDRTSNGSILQLNDGERVRELVLI
jgi:hypothetical protein